MGVSQDKGEPPRSYVEIETVINKLQERINAHDNRITDDEVRMGDFA